MFSIFVQFFVLGFFVGFIACLVWQDIQIYALKRYLLHRKINNR
jgi:hypothetical protein